MRTTMRRAEDAPAYEPSGSSGWSVMIRPRSIWVAAAVLALLVAIAIVLMKAIYVVILLFIAIIFAEGLRPIVNWLARRHVPRPLAVLLIYLALLAIFAALFWLLLQPLIAQVSQLTNNLPYYASQVQGFIQRVQSTLGNNPQLKQGLSAAQASLGGIVNGLFSLLVQIPLLIGSTIFAMVIVAVMAFFWLTGVENLKPFFVGLLPRHLQPEARDILDDMAHRLGGYVQGVVVNMFVIGILSGGANWLLNVPYAVLLGVVAGLTELIPYFGPWISGSVAVLVALIAVGPLKAVEIVGLYVLIQEIEGHTLIPYVMMRRVRLNPLVVIIAVLLGTELLGIIGGILAVPAAAIVEVLIVRVIGPLARHASQRALPESAGGSVNRPKGSASPTT